MTVAKTSREKAPELIEPQATPRSVIKGKKVKEVFRG